MKYHQIKVDIATYVPQTEATRRTLQGALRNVLIAVLGQEPNSLSVVLDPVLPEERGHFEDLLFNAYFIAHVSKDLKLDTSLKDKATLMAKDEKGDYVDEAVAQAWFGWKLFAEWRNPNIEG